jgi:hypothetical protein
MENRNVPEMGTPLPAPSGSSEFTGFFIYRSNDKATGARCRVNVPKLSEPPSPRLSCRRSEDQAFQASPAPRAPSSAARRASKSDASTA